MMENIVAIRILEGELPGKGRFPVRIVVEKPVSWNGNYRCRVTLEGLDTQPMDIPGVDSLQSISLACRFIKTNLDYFERHGGKLYFPGDNEPVSGI